MPAVWTASYSLLEHSIIDSQESPEPIIAELKQFSAKKGMPELSAMQRMKGQAAEEVRPE